MCGAAALGTFLPALTVCAIVLAVFVALVALETQQRFRETIPRAL